MKCKLAVAVDTLVGLGYIDEEKQKPYNNFMQYTYRLTPEGKNFTFKQIEKMKKESQNVYSILSSKMDELNKMDTTGYILDKLSRFTRFVLKWLCNLRRDDVIVVILYVHVL